MRPTEVRVRVAAFRLCLSLPFVLLSGASSLNAQQDADSSSLTVGASVDLFYADYFQDDASDSGRFSGGVSPRNRQFGLNLLQAGLLWREGAFEGEAVVQAGDIPASSWSPEFPMIGKAVIGARLGEHFRVDAGLFPTHIGVEVPQPGANPLSSIAVVTNFEPFYQSGLRFGYSAGSIDLQLHLLNGYNTFVDADENKAAGLYLAWKLSDGFRLSYASILGNERSGASPGSSFRTYHNLGLVYRPTEPVEVIAGFDVGTENGTGEQSPVLGGLMTVRFFPIPDWSFISRLEFFRDPDGILAGESIAGGGRGPELYGVTAAAEYKPLNSSYIRLEGRWLKSTNGTTLPGDGNSLQEQFGLVVTAGYSFTVSLRP